MADSPHAQAQPATIQLYITLLGTPQLTVHDAPLVLLYRLAVALQPVSRGQLCFLLWPDISEAAARRILSAVPRCLSANWA